MAQKNAAYYERKAADAKAREAYYRNRQYTPKATVSQRDAESYIYRSMFLKFTGAGDNTSNDHLPFSINVTAKAITAIGGANVVGLLGSNTTTVPTGLARPIKGTGLHPTMAMWYEGTATPRVGKTKWQVRSVKYYDSAADGSQTFYRVPISQAAGDFGVAQAVSTFQKIFTGTDKEKLLGRKNGRANLQIEYAPSFFAVNS
jgi:hypothetical protein